ncbi:hypothetical protein D3C76_1551890 [compost metagenome]
MGGQKRPQVEQAADGQRPTQYRFRYAVFSLPTSGEQHADQVSARRTATGIKTLRITAVFTDMTMNPGQRSTRLIDDMVQCHRWR